jgi:predicted ABC-type ATPase
MNQKILDSITEFKNKTNNEIIPITEKKLQFETNSYDVYINNIKLKKTSEFLITFKCVSCNSLNTVSTTQFLKKIRECKTSCFQCNLLKHNNIILSPEENRKNSIELFDTYSEEYKNSYFLNHLDDEDYNRIKTKIVNLCNGKYSKLDNIEYWSIYQVNNQMIFSSVMYDKINKTIFKVNQPVLKCDSCEKNWCGKSLECFKNSHKILCDDCKSSNRILKIKPIKNIINETVIYQSKLELKFIDWCKTNGFIIINGPHIEYTIDNKTKKHKITFQINNILIDVNKRQAKLDVIESSIKNKNYRKYFMITPNNWCQMTKELKQMLNKI